VDRAAALLMRLSSAMRPLARHTEGTASQVLAGTAASSTEMTYTYVALCRAAGLPARLVSTYYGNNPQQGFADEGDHLTLEVFTRERGWVPADPGHYGAKAMAAQEPPPDRIAL